MKIFFLFALMLTFTVASMAQLSRNARKYEQRIPKDAIDNAVMNPTQPANTTVNTKAVLEDQLGTTRYDLQTNEAIQNRFYVYPDGTMAGTWTMGMLETTYTDRGTGYNFFDGTSWGTAPSIRIETVRVGWPSYCPWNGGGELIIAHGSGTSWVMNTRPIKGTGTWTQTLAPPAPSGVPGMAWSRTITNGTTHQNIHVIGMTLPVANPPGVVYKGLDGALLYWRSTNGGTTWDKSGIQLPGLDSTNYDSFGGDEYAWGTPHGDTIYFAVGGPYSDTYIMQSNDNGETWTKIPILSNANTKIPAGVTYKAPWYSTDGSVACEMGKNGVIHFLSGIGGGEIGNPTASSKYILINLNGLIYWNTTMPMLQDSLNLDTLDAHGQLLGYYSDGPNAGDTLKVVQSYRIGLTSHPQISIDDASGDMVVIWDGLTWQYPQSNTNYNYRHIWTRSWRNATQEWVSPQLDLNSDISYIFMEFVFPSMAKTLLNNNFDYIYQTGDSPGSSVLTTTLSTQTWNIEHRQLRTIVGIPTNDSKKIFVSQNFPNPVTGTTTFNVNLDKAANVSVEVSNLVGQKLMIMDKGVVSAGAQKFTIDCSSLTSGVYFYTVKQGDKSVTKKMIVQ